MRLTWSERRWHRRYLRTIAADTDLSTLSSHVLEAVFERAVMRRRQEDLAVRGKGSWLEAIVYVALQLGLTFLPAVLLGQIHL